MQFLALLAFYGYSHLGIARGTWSVSANIFVVSLPWVAVSTYGESVDEFPTGLHPRHGVWDRKQQRTALAAPTGGVRDTLVQRPI